MTMLISTRYLNYSQQHRQSHCYSKWINTFWPILLENWSFLKYNNLDSNRHYVSSFLNTALTVWKALHKVHSVATTNSSTCQHGMVATLVTATQKHNNTRALMLLPCCFTLAMFNLTVQSIRMNNAHAYNPVNSKAVFTSSYLHQTKYIHSGCRIRVNCLYLRQFV